MGLLCWLNCVKASSIDLKYLEHFEPSSAADPGEGMGCRGNGLVYTCCRWVEGYLAAERPHPLFYQMWALPYRGDDGVE